jgi:hypothetical protein
MEAHVSWTVWAQQSYRLANLSTARETVGLTGLNDDEFNVETPNHSGSNWRRMPKPPFRVASRLGAS